MIASSANYIFSLDPLRLKSTAQMINSAATSVAGMCGNLIGGVLIDRIGVKAFYLSSAIWILVCVGLFALSFVFGAKVLKISIPKVDLPGVTVPATTEAVTEA
jgi:predicted MFS family arabinose efflux permease